MMSCKCFNATPSRRCSAKGCASETSRGEARYTQPRMASSLHADGVAERSWSVRPGLPGFEVCLGFDRMMSAPSLAFL